MVKWETIEKVGHLTLLFLIIFPSISIICFLLFKNQLFIYLYFITGIIIGIILSYIHEHMMFNYEGRD